MVSRVKTFCLLLIGALLSGYLMGGKAFAYIQIPPVYIGEITLAAAAVLFLAANDYRIVKSSGLVWLIAIYCLWCFSRTWPYLSEFGLDAARDSAIYYYSAFAVLVAASVSDIDAVDRVITFYARMIRIAAIALPVAILYTMNLMDEESRFVLVKAGDVAVHLTGMLAFRLLLLDRMATGRHSHVHRLIEIAFWACWTGSLFWSVLSRGAFLALTCGTLAVVVFGYARRRVMQLAGVGIVALLALAALDLSIDLERRNLSAAQLIANILSIGGITPEGEAFSRVDSKDLEGTMNWRLQWWGDIIDYTVHGPYFWTGKGFGENLADSDGYQTDYYDNSLRSPHNGHFTILARAGVPGLALWLTVLGTFAFQLSRMTVRLQRAGLENWARLNVWILAYWLAALVNASFDVYLEGPQGGIWFWSIMGLGIGVLVLERSLLVAEPAPAQALRPTGAGT
ncbi:O-antigen ligase family protein [Azospirillum thermophilum]|uniref:O-antigen polymerase n=1 Tax=Azospirillum thermophilum TaxID=2202148 RepID=A0A2S2CLD3_9PROT|nr:O-antigen ligase family protein [Azospirillum thermophilum]AWK85180.1 O-antigen polymerase [Azospirillum thermophilum]